MTAYNSANSATKSAESVAVGAADNDAQVILSPPTPLNPVPILPAALRIDNRENLLSLLQSVVGRQLLIFENEGLRTLLLRQVLSDPNARVFQGKKNWDPQTYFPIPQGLSIIGTHLLSKTKTTGRFTSSPASTETGAEVSLIADDWDTTVDVVTYFLRPCNLSQTTTISERIRNWTRPRTHHRIVYLPQATAISHKLLANSGMTSAPNVSIHRLQLNVFPLENDVLSLEYPDAMKETEVEGTPSSLITTVARSLLTIQDVVGRIPRVQVLGTLGEEVVKKMMTLTLEESLTSPNTSSSEEGDIVAMLVLDRKVDMVTPMLTPLTYEGLLDEVIGIDCGFMNANVEVINPESEESEKVSLAVTGSDTLYQEVRDQHVEKFGSFLQNQAKALQESHANFTNKEKKKDLTEIHQFVKNIPIFTKNLRSLTNHIHLAELVKASTEESGFRERWQTERSIVEGETCYEMLEEWIACQYPPFRILRLLCLQSICGGGIKSARYDSIRRDIIQTYGFEFLFVLNNLERAGLLRRRDWMDSTNPFNMLRKSLILINAEVDPVEPDDISYVSSGYAPMSVRLVQTAMKGWTGKEEILRELPARVVDISQQNPPQDYASAIKKGAGISLGLLAESKQGDNRRKPTMVVVYVGGVTYMEIAALRFLSKRASFPYHIIVVTTKIINGVSLLHSLGSYK
jgi:vacuolar protein sorting-associated protein 33A